MPLAGVVFDDDEGCQLGVGKRFQPEVFVGGGGMPLLPRGEGTCEFVVVESGGDFFECDAGVFTVWHQHLFELVSQTHMLVCAELAH